jgi:hypothetical protein
MPSRETEVHGVDRGHAAGRVVAHEVGDAVSHEVGHAVSHAAAQAKVRDLVWAVLDQADQVGERAVAREDRDRCPGQDRQEPAPCQDPRGLAQRSRAG